MELINPITFSSAMLTSTTASESVALWSAATAYTALQYARLDTTHRIYQCIIGNTNASPDANLTGASPKWIDAGATNAYAMFDEKWGTQTTAVSSLTVVLTPLVPIDSLAVLNMLGSTLVVSCTVAGSQIYTKTISLQTDVGVFDWKSYFLAPIVAAVDKVITDLFPYALQVITLTISGPGAVAIGNVSMGALVSLGRLWNSPTIGITDYSTKSVDTFGNVVVAIGTKPAPMCHSACTE